jgi:acyl carrier protein/3-oxoacyl-(acyl-carrier-protein) synthase
LDAGLDSLGAVELRNALMTHLGVELPVTAAFDYPSVTSIVGYVHSLSPPPAALDNESDHLQGDYVPREDSNITVTQSSLWTSANTVEAIKSQVMATVRDVLGSEVEADEPLMNAGLDSLGAVELRNAISAKVGVQLPVTAAFDYPSVDAIVEYLASFTCSKDASVPQQTNATRFRNITTSSSLSVSPLNNPSTFHVAAYASHTNDRTSPVDTISTIPPVRWDVEQHQVLSVGLLHPRFGATVPDPQLFDASHFAIAPTEARCMDPQHRMVLTCSASALQSYSSQLPVPTTSKDAASRVGVFVGISTTDYSKLVTLVGVPPNAYSATGGASSVVAGRVSYLFGLQGPSLVVDTACSSSLVCVHLALRSGSGQNYKPATRSQVFGVSALVSGVNLTLDPATTATFGCAGMLAPDGRCKTMDQTADGYVRGEACASFVFSETSSFSREDSTLSGEWSGMLRMGVSGSSVNQDGRSSSLTAPNGPSQQAVMREALGDAGKNKKM